MNSPSSTTAVIKIGTDRVHVAADRLLIDARELMDWPVREFYRVPIYFQGRKYYVRTAGDAHPPYARRYELWLWPADQPEQTTQMVIYDEAYVTARDAAAKRRRGEDHWHLILLPFYPFLGFFWSGFKNRVLARVGFAPRELTAASIAIGFSLMMAEGVFVGWLGGGLLMWFLKNGNLRMADVGLLILITADVVMRYSQHLQTDVDQPWGFCEWLWPRKRKP